MVFYAASYYPTCGDPIGTAVALCTCDIVGECDVHQTLEKAVEKAGRLEAVEIANTLEEDESCSTPIVAGMAFTYRAKELFTAAELKEHRRELMNGAVVWLHR